MRVLLCIFFFQAEDGIRDRSPSRGLGAACGTPEEGHDLTSRAGISRAELGGGIAAGYLLRLVVIRPQDRIVIYAAFAYVNKGIYGRLVIGILCSADGADAALVTVSRIIFFLVAAVTFVPMLVCVLAPALRPVMAQSRILILKGSGGRGIADLSALAALVVNCIMGAVSSSFQSFVLNDLLIESMGMRRILIGRFHADFAGRHCEGGGFAGCVRKGDACTSAYPYS